MSLYKKNIKNSIDIINDNKLQYFKFIFLKKNLLTIRLKIKKQIKNSGNI